MTKFCLVILIFTVCLFTVVGNSCSAARDWRKTVRETNEETLRTDLVMMRKAIRSYTLRRGELPQTLKDLDTEGVYSTVPDPITGRADWQVTIGEDPALAKGKRGVVDVHSASTAISSQGTPYNTW